jgi:hypothetical protein
MWFLPACGSHFFIGCFLIRTASRPLEAFCFAKAFFMKKQTSFAKYIIHPRFPESSYKILPTRQGHKFP